jgi:general secretion pathway protein D
MRGATIVAAALMLMTAVGCSTSRTAKEGKKASSRENWDAAVYHYLELVAKDPENVEYRIGLTRARQKAAQEHFQRGLALRQMGQLMVARNEIEMALQLDPTHQYAEQVLEDIEKEIEILSRPGGAEELEELKRQAREAKVKPPVLDPKSDEPITLSFPKAKSVKEIYRAMGKAYGFNVIFDPNLRDDKLAIELKDVDAERALELVMQHAGHFYKVLDEHTIIIAEDNPQKRREYEDLVIKTFFLSNADVKEVDKLLRSLIEARRLSTNEQLNAITLRDTADKVAIAERLIAINDKAKAEVVVDVELLEVDATKTSELGMNLSTYSFTLQADLAAINPLAPDGALYLDDLSEIARENIFVNVPSVVINLVKASGNAALLAQPQLRITEGEQAQLHLGDRVPIPVTSFNTGNTVGGNVVPITSFQYQDIGIRIEVEPRVHHNREVTLNLMVEVSQLGETVPVGPDQQAVTIGTRTIQSTIRLKSGESSLLAGLIQKTSTQGESKTPLLSDIPGIGRLFTNKSVSTKTTDLVLTLTPHIIRFPDIQEEDLAPVWVGTESRISFSGSRSPRVQSGRTTGGPFDPDEQRRRTPPAPSSGDPNDDSPFGSRRPRRVTPPQQDPGVELVPGSNQKSLQPDSIEESMSRSEAPEPSLDVAHPPLVVSLEPSVVSLDQEERVTLQLVVRDSPGPYRMSLAMSYDAGRLELESLAPAPGVQFMAESIDEIEGLLNLDLMVGEGRQTAHAVAAFQLRALAPGPVPLTLGSAGATISDGSTLPVAVSDGAVFVSGSSVAKEP